MVPFTCQHVRLFCVCTYIYMFLLSFATRNWDAGQVSEVHSGYVVRYKQPKLKQIATGELCFPFSWCGFCVQVTPFVVGSPNLVLCFGQLFHQVFESESFYNSRVGRWMGGGWVGGKQVSSPRGWPAGPKKFVPPGMRIKISSQKLGCSDSPLSKKMREKRGSFFFGSWNRRLFSRCHSHVSMSVYFVYIYILLR